MTLSLLLLVINKIARAQRNGVSKRLKWEIKQWYLTCVRTKFSTKIITCCEALQKDYFMAQKTGVRTATALRQKIKPKSKETTF